MTASLILLTLVGAAAFWNFGTRTVSAQKADNALGGVTEYNARNEFALTQGGTSGVWNYGYSASDTDNTFNLFTATRTSVQCGSATFEDWYTPSSGDGTPVLSRNASGASCLSVPPEMLFVHPGPFGNRTVLRWTAPAAGTFQITGAFQRQNPSATTDLKILKNAATPGEALLFAANLNSNFQQAFNFAVTVAAGDKLDFSVGFGNGSYVSDGSLIAVTIGQPVTACLTAPANLQVNVPGENSPSDVASVNTNAQLVGDATYTNAGRVGRAFELDGSGDYVRIEDNAAQRPTSALTAEGWFKFDSTSGIVSLISKPVRGSALNSYTLYLEGGQLRGLVGNSSQFTRALSSFVPQTGVWHHLAFTYDFTGGVSVLKLYANGVEVTSGVDGTANLPLFYDANPFPLLIGGEYENNAPAFTLDGQADEVAVYGRALSQTEIFEIVKRGNFGKCPPAACAQTPNGLVSWFAGEQNALDSRSNNHAANNGATFATGKVGQAFNFNGSSKVAVPGAALNLQTITVEAWIQPTSSVGLQTIVSKFEHFSSNLSYNLVLFGTSLRWQFNTTGLGSPAFDANGAALFDGQFHHVAATYDGAVSNIYIDGVLVRTDNFAGGALTSSSTPFYIGAARDSGSDAHFFNGRIDEVSIYSRALSTAEISSVYNANSSGKCKPVATNPAANLAGFWTGDGDARDFAGEDQNGTNNGATFAVGRVGQSFRFTADPQNISIPDSAAMRSANFTIEAWAKSDSNSGVRHIFAKTLGTGTADSYVLWNNSGTLNAAICAVNFACDTISAPMFNTGEWHHVAFTFDDAGDSLRLYVDGTQIASGASGLSIGYDTHPALIGADYANEVIADSWRGLLDEVSFYDRALSASEIAVVYNAGVAGKLKEKTVSVLPPLSSKTKGLKNAFSAQSLLAPATVELSDATVTFANLTSGGTVSESGIDLANLPPLPSNVSFTGLAYDIRATASYQNGAADDVQVCFNVPALQGLSNLRIMHLENGAWVNRTAAGNTGSNLCTDNLASLSPFVIVQALAPTAAAVSVSGKVSDSSGAGIGGVSVTLTDSQGRSVYAKTNNFGSYSFTDVRAGDVYIVSVASKRYAFTVSSRAVNVQDAVENVDFTADSGAFRQVPSTRQK